MTPGQRTMIERFVCGVIAKELKVSPHHILPTTNLFAGTVTFDNLKNIAVKIEEEFEIILPVLAYRNWAQVSDVVTTIFAAIRRREIAA